MWKKYTYVKTKIKRQIKTKVIILCIVRISLES